MPKLPFSICNVVSIAVFQKITIFGPFGMEKLQNYERAFTSIRQVKCFDVAKHRWPWPLVDSSFTFSKNVTLCL